MSDNTVDYEWARYGARAEAADRAKEGCVVSDIVIRDSMMYRGGSMGVEFDVAPTEPCPWSWHGLRCVLGFAHPSPHLIEGEQPQFDAVLAKAKAEAAAQALADAVERVARNMWQRRGWGDAASFDRLDDDDRARIDYLAEAQALLAAAPASPGGVGG